MSLESKNRKIQTNVTTGQHPFSIKKGTGNGLYNNEVFYVDRNGNVVAENATIRVNRAGITNEGSNDNSIRIWAGETYENRNSAPFRVTQNGKVTATNIDIEGGNINVDSDVNIGKKLNLNPGSFKAEINWGDKASIYIDPASQDLFLQSNGNIRANGNVVATQDWVKEYINGLLGLE